MSNNLISKSDITDVDIVDANELASDGYTIYASGITLTNINSIAHQITISGYYVLHNRDNPIAVNDRILISGSTTSDGYYTIASLIDDSNFTVNESINSATVGTISFMYAPSGAKQVGYDPSQQSSITAHNVQDAITELSNSSFNIGNHESLNTLVHFLARDGYSDITYTGNKLTNYTVYRNPSKTIKDRQYVISYTGYKVQQVVVTQYDNIGVLLNTLTETYSYSGNRIIHLDSVKT